MSIKKVWHFHRNVAYMPQAVYTFHIVGISVQMGSNTVSLKDFQKVEQIAFMRCLIHLNETVRLPVVPGPECNLITLNPLTPITWHKLQWVT